MFLNDIDSLKTALKVLDNFKNTSGLKLNNSKTEILQLGVPLTSNYTLLNLKWEKKRIYALGSWFYKDSNKSITETYEKRLDILKATLDLWARRNLIMDWQNYCDKNNVFQNLIMQYHQLKHQIGLYLEQKTY